MDLHHVCGSRQATKTVVYDNKQHTYVLFVDEIVVNTHTVRDVGSGGRNT